RRDPGTGSRGARPRRRAQRAQDARDRARRASAAPLLARGDDRVRAPRVGAARGRYARVRDNRRRAAGEGAVRACRRRPRRRRAARRPGGRARARVLPGPRRGAGRMTAIAARAPGKVVLTGDYAVLCGAPAIVAAIDRYADVRLDLAGDAGPLSVESL